MRYQYDNDLFSLCSSWQADQNTSETVNSPQRPKEDDFSQPGQVIMAKLGRINRKLLQQRPFSAGALADNFQNWARLTTDQTILHVIQGFTLELVTAPRQRYYPQQLFKTRSEIAIANTLVNELLAKQVVEEIPKFDRSGFVSNIFLREKKTGSYRVILNLKPFNEFVKYRHFKMATIHSALELITPGCYMASIDLSDAYYSVRVANSDRKYLQFAFQNKCYRFTCLANGISSAPRTFTKILKVPLSELRERYNITIMAYLDDLLLVADNPKDLLLAVDRTIALLTSLGFSISATKSALKPAQQIQFLGFTLDSRSMLVTLGDGKANNIKLIIQELINSHSVSIRHLAMTVGKLAATLPANKYGQVYIKQLEQDKAMALYASVFDFEGIYLVTERARKDLLWWLARLDTVSRPIALPNPSITIFTDASFQGWGCHLPKWNVRTGHRWGPVDHHQDINYLELKAVLYSLKACCNNVTNSHILIESDNTTTVVGINRQGSTHSTNCNNVTRQIWQWAMAGNNWLSATHCPGRLNTQADEASRIFNDSTEWTISKTLFRQITDSLGKPDIDLFASYLNYRLKPYCAWQPDPGAMHIDCLSLGWSDFNLLYIFPPFSLIGRILQKISTDNATAIIIVPDWPTQPWFTRLRQLLVRTPLEIPVTPHTLHLPHDPNRPHPLAGRLRLLACKVCAKPTANREFLKVRRR